MLLRNNPRVYKWVVVCSFLVLSILVGILIFNTYRYKDETFQNYQQQAIEKAYGEYVIDDKIYPNGEGVFSAYLEPYLPHLVNLLETDVEKFVVDQNRILDIFLTNLRKTHNMDLVFSEILKNENLDTTLLYSLQFDRLEVFVPATKSWYAFFPVSDTVAAMQLAGTLKKVNNNNRVLKLSVNAGEDVAYRFTYSLYVDYPNRVLRIMEDMMPFFCFSVVCIFFIIVINYFTYRNWVDQRKEAQLTTDFLNHMRHEFNTPITTILVCANSLKEQHGAMINKDVVLSMGQIIERQAGRLNLYFKQIMESVTIQEQTPNLVLADISEVTQEFLFDISLRYGTEISVEYTPLPKQERVVLDTSFLFSILDNLISNAVKFTVDRSPVVKVYWAYSEDVLQLHVEDNGVGIAPEDGDRIFGKFYRSKNAGNQAGLGLGLYYVKTCVLRLGWNITLGKKVGEGACFIMTIHKRKD